jgi:hypothetical protein
MNQDMVENKMTLKQACSSEYQGAQSAFKDSMIHWKSAIHITYRDSLRSSSMREPRDPLLKVVIDSTFWPLKCVIVVHRVRLERRPLFREPTKGAQVYVEKMKGRA